MAKRQKQMRELQEGSYVMMEEEPCKINAYNTVKPGKYDNAKARVEARSVSDSKKHSFSQPVDAKVWVPIARRKQDRVASATSEDVQIMDLETHWTFAMRIPGKEDLSPEDEIGYLECEGQRRII